MISSFDHFGGKDDGFAVAFARIASVVALRFASGITRDSLLDFLAGTALDEAIGLATAAEAFGLDETGAFEVLLSSSILFFFFA